jgi:ligand-binding sensor domain-containing protein
MKLDMKCSIFVSAILIGTLITAGFGCLVPSSMTPSPQPPVSSYPTLSRIAPLSENKPGWTTFTTDNGLADNWTTSVIQDRQGVLWVSSSKGITRFDGLHWVKYTDFPQDASDNSSAQIMILKSAQDKQGNLWFGTDSGAYEYTGKEWRNFTPDNTDGGLPGPIVTAILVDNQDNIWFGTEVGLGRVGMRYYGVTRYSGTVWTTFPLSNGSMSPYVEAIFQDRENNIWVGTIWGVFRYYWTDWQKFNMEDGLTDNYVHVIAQDDQGKMWFGTDNGTSCYDEENWRTFTIGNGLIGRKIQCILKDNKGNLWFGAYATNRLFSFDGTNWQNFNPWPNRGYYNVRSIFQDDEGNIWFSTTEGLVRYTPD